MEEYMLETNVDPKIILGKVQRHMTSLALSSQGPSTSRSTEDEKLGEGFFKANPLM
jgi:hypothetical protein